jgi:hypothetical protein
LELLWALLLLRLPMLILVALLVLALMLLMRNMFLCVLRGMEVLLEVHDNANPDMFFEELNTRIVSTPTALRPRIDLDRTVIAEHVRLLATNRE